MTKEEFIAAIGDIETFLQEANDLNFHLDKIGKGNYSDIGGHFLDRHIELLSKFVRDEDDWISWYVFENGCGKKGLTAGGYGKRMCKIDSARKLWDLIEEGKKQ